MIKPNELRLENLILNRHNEIDIVTDRIFQDFRFPKMDGNFGYKGVKTTEEWLLKFGFKKDSVRDYNICTNAHGNAFLTAFSDDYETVYFYQNYVISTDYSAKVKYVHQLQNLYFALTQEELKIK